MSSERIERKKPIDIVIKEAAIKEEAQKSLNESRRKRDDFEKRWNDYYSWRQE